MCQVQVTFSEKGTKNITHILASENMKSLVSQPISVKSQWFIIFHFAPKSVQHQSKEKTALWNPFPNKVSRTSNFQKLIFVAFSEKVCCKNSLILCMARHFQMWNIRRRLQLSKFMLLVKMKLIHAESAGLLKVSISTFESELIN